MALFIEVKVVPQSGKASFELDKKGDLRCFLKSAPEKGAANKELIKLLSKRLKVPQDDIEIVSGLTIRNKKIKLHVALLRDQFYDKMGLSYQEELF